jgi:deoxyadenosine/deoxycytidine kinase
MSTEPRDKNPIICEIVGLAGVGKSSLLEELKQQNFENVGISFRNLVSWPLQSIAIAKVLPVYLKILLERKVENRPAYAAYKAKHGPLATEFRHMTYLQLGIELFSQDSFLQGKRMMIFEEGPIFKLAWLYLFGSIQYSKTAMLWWHHMASTWVRHLTHCVTLTASVPVMLERVHNREQSHNLKGLSAIDCNHFYSDYYKTFDLLMEKYFRNQKIRHLTIDTEANDIKSVSSQVTKIILAES